MRCCRALALAASDTTRIACQRTATLNGGLREELATDGAFLTLVEQAKIDGLCAAIARAGGVVCEQLTGNQCLHARGFDLVDMHEDIGPAAIGHDKAISAIFVKEFDAPTRH
jgi:hypothetical protein